MKIGFIILFASLLLGQLGAFMPAPNATVYLHDVAVCVLIGVGVFHVLAKKKFVRPRLLRPIVAFVGVALISLLVALLQFTPAQVGQGSLYLVRWIVYALVYMRIIQTLNRGTFLLRGLYITGSIFSLVGLVQYILYPNLRNLWYLGWDPHYFRLFSTFLDPNFAGLFILLTFLLGCTRIMSMKWMWVLQGINFLALYLTYSRGSYLALLAAGLVWIILEKKWRILWFVGAAIFLVVVMPRPGGDTLRLLRTDSTVARITNWQETIQLIQRSPMIGHGFNTLRFVERKSVLQSPADPVSKAAAGVDNSFLFLMATVGSIGASVYLWLLWASVGISRVSHLAILTALVVHSQFTNSLFYPWIMLWLWIYVGASETIYDRSQRARRS